MTTLHYTCASDERKRTIGIAGKPDNLRTRLRHATKEAHDRLDNAMRRASGWNDIGDYAEFLKIQYAARQPVEAWLAAHAPLELRPPEQSPLIAHDLDALGMALPAVRTGFTMKGNERACTLGASWVLAGSALGNRSILKEVSKAGHDTWPTHFLGGGAMLNFWSDLRAELEVDAGNAYVAGAISGANAVFDHFLAHAHGANLTLLQDHEAVQAA